MEWGRDRSPEGVPGQSEASFEMVGGQAEGGSGLRAASEAVAVVFSSALAGGGTVMLAGVALGAIDPFASGLLGAAAGACIPALLARRPWWRRVRGVLGG
jgi:hypothetical protein